MYAKLRPRRSTATEWSTINPILMEGELGIECPDSGIGTGLSKFKIGDSKTHWNDLPYAFDATAANAIYGGSPDVSYDICLRHGTTDEWESTNPVLKPAEIVFDSTLNCFKCGDGQHTFKELDYIGYNFQLDPDYNFGDIDHPDPTPSPEQKDYDFGDIDQL